MAKHKRQVRAALNKDISKLEHTEVFDDHLLPEASEIQQLSTIDPYIITWLKERAAKEQDFRHETFKSRIKLTDDHDRREHTTTRLGLAVYFLLVLGCLAASFILVREDHDIEGSIFGGAAVIFAFTVLLTRKQTHQLNK